MRSIDRNQKGVSAVEFAIIAPLFISLLFAIIEFGLIIYTKAMLTHAGREGARLGVVFSNPRRSDADIRAEVQKYLNLCELTSDATVTITPPLATRSASGTPMTVVVDYTYQFFVVPKNITNFFGGKMDNIRLTSTTVMNME